MLGGAQRQLVALHPGTREEVGRSFQRFLSEFEGPWDNFQLFIGDLLSLIVSESVSVSLRQFWFLSLQSTLKKPT